MKIKFDAGSKVAILGLGRSGFESALFLRAQGYEVFVSEQSESDAVREKAECLRQQRIDVEYGKHSEEKILQSDWVLISPGIAPRTPLRMRLSEANLPVFSEIEVASWFCPTPDIVAVSGTSGKTTVTTLISRVLASSGRRVVRAGNIGNPWIGELGGIRPSDTVVLELSSFQLYDCREFHPKVGILLNLSENHLDWHPDMPDYVRAKLRLFDRQTESDYALIREADRQRYFPQYPFRSKVLPFGEETENPNHEVVRRVGGIFGISEPEVSLVLEKFEGIEHRLEKFADLDGVSYVNDSKATTTASLIWALRKFEDGRVILLAGGHPKSEDFDLAREWVTRKVKLAVILGEAKPLLRKAWQGASPLVEAADFADAVHKAKSSAVAGDTVLLSPACASFDMFKNYDERGKIFKRMVLQNQVPV